MPLDTYMQQVYPIWLHPRVDLQDHQTAQDVVAQLISAVDPAWIAAAEHADPMQLLAAPSTADIATQLRDRYSWLTAQGKLVQLEAATVVPSSLPLSVPSLLVV
jgi:hypothetical protein